MFLGLDMSGLENTMFSLAREIRTIAKGKVVARIKDVLTRKAPDNKQILAMKVEGEQLELMPQDAVYVLSRLAYKMQTHTKEVGLSEANLEHVFPKKPSPEWTDASALEQYLWHLGNLTMLGKRMNGAIGNAGYSKKRPYYQKNTELKISQDLAAQYQM
jgi:hypothetical protein